MIKGGAFMQLTAMQQKERTAFREFVRREIIPNAERFDNDQWLPGTVIRLMAAEGFMGSIVPDEKDESPKDMIRHGLLCEEISRGSASLLSLLTVHGMVSKALLRWGSDVQKKIWLPALACGETIAAFALTEPRIGSDARNVETSAVFSKGRFILSGRKKWISGGQVAGLFLVIARCDGKPSAFLVPRESPGFSVTPIKNMLGFRSAMIAALDMCRCEVPMENLVGQIGAGFSHVAGAALDHGRYSIGWGCVGLAQACLDACMTYSGTRKQFGVYLKDHALIQKMISDMVVNIKAARLLCHEAGQLQNNGDPGLILTTAAAKYFASRVAFKSASDAVQIHGANGCSSDYPVQRYFRDAKIMEIIEGSNQIQQVLISKCIHPAGNGGEEHGKAS